MLADYHMHSDFSGDSDSAMEIMIKKGISLGLPTICFTEHQDWDYPYNSAEFSVDTPAYLECLKKLKEKYKNDITILFGVELGLQPHLGDIYRNYINQYPFDFVIGSSHLVNGVDPYFPDFFSDRTEQEAYMEYFQSILINIDHFKEFDVYGHIDYVVRYGPNQNKYYSYKKYQDILDQILLKIIQIQKGIEINTAGFKYGLGHPNPHEDIIKRYRELGGEIITVGSDAHKPEHIAYEFDKVAPILKACGFQYYTVFKNRKPEFIKL